MKLIITEYPNHPAHGVWGMWKYGGEHGTFGRNIMRGMWADLDGDIFMGLQTCEQAITDSFRESIVRWRDLEKELKRRYSETEA